MIGSAQCSVVSDQEVDTGIMGRLHDHCSLTTSSLLFPCREQRIEPLLEVAESGLGLVCGSGVGGVDDVEQSCKRAQQRSERVALHAGSTAEASGFGGAGLL